MSTVPAFEVDAGVGEDDFRTYLRLRLALQEPSFQDRWWPLVNDSEPHGRLLGYAALTSALTVHENWQAKG